MTASGTKDLLSRKKAATVSSPATTPGELYRSLLAANELTPDDHQAAVIHHMEGLYGALSEYDCKPKDTFGFIRRLFASRENAPRGLYLWGGVGRGKSMLMDLFFTSAPVKRKRRVHFHEFMIDVHHRLNALRRMPADEKRRHEGFEKSDDPIPPLAHEIAQDACLLCFDEFHVTDVADAMILGRLFTALLNNGTVIVATSNRAPHDLYKNGLNRQLFLPFIDLLKARFDIMDLNGPTDYRLQRLSGVDIYYHVPNGEQATEELREAFFRLTDHSVDDASAVPSETLDVHGRTLFVPKALKGVAVFSFKRLCANPLGAADYLAIAHRYHTVIIVGVPKMGAEQRNEAKRFTTLIDTLYEQKVKLLMAADAPPHQLYTTGDGAFEFERTISRLIEMQSPQYLALGHGAD